MLMHKARLLSWVWHAFTGTSFVTLHICFECDFQAGTNVIMSSADARELVVTRLSKLHQLLEGRGHTCNDYRNLITPDGLLDVLLLLFDECSKDSVASRSRHARAFIEKCEFNWLNTVVVVETSV